MMIRVVTRVINENKGTQRMCINLMTSAKTFNEYFLDNFMLEDKQNGHHLHTHCGISVYCL